MQLWNGGFSVLFLNVSGSNFPEMCRGGRWGLQCEHYPIRWWAWCVWEEVRRLAAADLMKDMTGIVMEICQVWGVLKSIWPGYCNAEVHRTYSNASNDRYVTPLSVCLDCFLIWQGILICSAVVNVWITEKCFMNSDANLVLIVSTEIWFMHSNIVYTQVKPFWKKNRQCFTNVCKLSTIINSFIK